jgi:hypothetical protein
MVASNCARNLWCSGGICSAILYNSDSFNELNATPSPQPTNQASKQPASMSVSESHCDTAPSMVLDNIRSESGIVGGNCSMVLLEAGIVMIVACSWLMGHRTERLKVMVLLQANQSAMYCAPCCSILLRYWNRQYQCQSTSTKHWQPMLDIATDARYTRQCPR